MFKKLVLASIILFSGAMLSGCSTGSHTVKVVKPKRHWLPYSHKKHKKKKRTKIVRMKS